MNAQMKGLRNETISEYHDVWTTLTNMKPYKNLDIRFRDYSIHKIT